MDTDKLKIATAIGLLALILLMGWQISNAQEVKYCKNLRTGEIVVVQKNYPCPSGTVKI